MHNSAANAHAGTMDPPRAHNVTNVTDCARAAVCDRCVSVRLSRTVVENVLLRGVRNERTDAAGSTKYITCVAVRVRDFRTNACVTEIVEPADGW